MTDPIGIVGTVGGLVSLGLQVYAGITDYLESLKSRQDELRSTNSQLEVLRKSLAIVENALPRLASMHPHEYKTVLPSIETCYSELQTLNDMLQHLADSSSPSRTVKGQMKRLKYPFHRPSLMKLEDKVHRANSVLQMVLHVLKLYVIPSMYFIPKTNIVHSEAVHWSLKRQYPK